MARKFGAIDAALALIIEAWPAIPEAVRAGIVALVKATKAP
jgi:hypothetical protein